jgi:lipopolysaccharide export system permease protein
MNRIGQYITKKWLLLFLPSLAILMAAYLSGDLAFGLVKLSDQGISTSGVLLHFGLKLPTIFYQMAPIAALMATLLTITGMKRSGELGTMFASGISALRTSLPILLAAACVSIFSYYIDENVAPSANRMSQDIVRGASGSRYVVGTGRIWLLEGKRIVHIRNVENKGQLLMEPTILMIDETRPDALASRIDAVQAYWEDGAWTAVDSVTRHFDGEVLVSTETAPGRPIPIDISPDEFYRVRRKPEEMGRRELMRYVDNLRAAGLPYHWYEVRIFRNSAVAALPLLFSLLAIPVGFMVPVRGGVPVGIGLSVAVTIVFWALFSFTLSLGYSGILAAPVSAWTMNILFLAAGTLTLLLYRRPRLI